MDTKTITRRYDLDWLRVFAILSVFIYHSTRFFNIGYWHVQNPVLYRSVQIFQMAMETWLMPLVFVVSGVSILFAIGKGGFGKFLKDKTLRLFLPLAVGACTHISFQVYLERLSHGQFSGSYFAFLPHYFFDGFYVDGNPYAGNFAWMGLHLWYLMVLFIFSLALYPLFRWLGANGGRRLAWLGEKMAFPGGLYLFALPLMLIESVQPDALAGLTPGGWSLPLYSYFLLLGFILAGSQRLLEQVQAKRRTSIVAAAILTAAFLLVVAVMKNSGMVALSEQLDDALRSFASWCWILGFMGYAMQYFNRTTPFLNWANEAVLPFYILHQTVLIVIGYQVVRWPVPDPLKWLIIAGSSLPTILAIYEYLVRRNNVMRFLFGMKPLTPATVAAPKPGIPQSVQPM